MDFPSAGISLAYYLFLLLVLRSAEGQIDFKEPLYMKFVNKETHTNVSRVVMAQVVFRNGASTVGFTYPTDRYKNKRKYWSEGYGQLTNHGKRQNFLLGRALRQRYGRFMSDEYVPNEVYVMSSDADRAIMGSQLTLAGIYTPVPTDQKWHSEIDWQPIPVHTLPAYMDLVFRNRQGRGMIPNRGKCRKLEVLISQLPGVMKFRSFHERHPNLYNFLSNKTGLNITHMEEAARFQIFFSILNNFGYPLPEWAHQVFPEPLTLVRAYALSLPTFYTEMQRLKTGPLLRDLVKHIQSYLAGNESHFLYLYSGHDVDLTELQMEQKMVISRFMTGLMRALGYTAPLVPNSCDAVILELVKDLVGDYYVRGFYRQFNGSELHAMSIHGCDYLCPLKDFFRYTARVIPQDWADECDVVPAYQSLELEDPYDIYD
uniref:acid phosphatase n=1 Tax=Timema cristinae TaxID=61476 RepID=A0A7R9D1L9_TIMCR|nr:unnamed protein product [Timema cristinae]